MTDLWQRLKQRKLVQWTLAYVAAAFALLQGIDIVAQRFAWPDSIERILIIAASIGFFVTLLLAWYHGERGVQKVSGTEVLLLALLLTIGGGLLWKYSAGPHSAAVASVSTVAASGLHSTASPTNAATIDVEQHSASPASIAQVANNDDDSIAVLPFVNMSSDKEQDYFSDGLSEELLNQLAQLPQLRVIARTSSFSFKGKQVDIATIARTLGVAHVLEGSVRKSGNTLRISAQLIRASDSSQVWQQTYDRQLTDVFKVQDEIATAVVDALKVKLLPDQHLSNAYRSSNPEAYDQYLLGKEFYNRTTPADWRKAAAAFQRAIALDPDYGAPRAGLAAAEYSLADLAGDAASKQQALDSAELAVAKAPRLADAYAARGIIRLSFFRNWDGAGTDFEKALQLNPAASAAQLGNYRLLMAQGNLPEAIVAAREATKSNPLSNLTWTSLGRALYAAGDYSSADRALDRAREISSDSPYGNYAVGMNELAQGRAREALTTFGTAGDVYSLAGIAMAEYSLGHARRSRQALDDMVEKYGKAGAYQIAQAHAWRGEADKAFEWLDTALEYNDGGLSFLKSDPVMTRLSADPRFAALLKKMGLAE